MTNPPKHFSFIKPVRKAPPPQTSLSNAAKLFLSPNCDTGSNVQRKIRLDQNERDSLSTVHLQFEELGMKKFRKKTDRGFDMNEQVILRIVVEVAAEAATLAFQSSTMGFDRDLDKLEAWFGQQSELNLPQITNGVYRMYRFLTDEEKCLKFIDARIKSGGVPILHHRFKPQVCSLTHDHGDPNSFETAMNWCSKISDMSMCVVETMFKLGVPMQVKIAMIFHELSHQLLGTNDCNGKQEPIFGKTACRKLAMSDCEGTIIVGENWSFFMSSFIQTEKEFMEDVADIL
ncbi:MAG: hypothetical protein KAH18_00335 [Psychromonas sp.]|nr:hypothetical protein [Psychromonas sp.]